jgi:hypothetical protein
MDDPVPAYDLGAPFPTLTSAQRNIMPFLAT